VRLGSLLWDVKDGLAWMDINYENVLWMLALGVDLRCLGSLLTIWKRIRSCAIKY
jgi:hypothetical protein